MNVVNLTRSENPLPQQSSSTQLEVDVQGWNFQILSYMYEFSGSHKVWKSITTTEFIHHPIGGGCARVRIQDFILYECSGISQGPKEQNFGKETR